MYAYYAYCIRKQWMRELSLKAYSNTWVGRFARVNEKGNKITWQLDGVSESSCDQIGPGMTAFDRVSLFALPTNKLEIKQVNKFIVFKELL